MQTLRKRTSPCKYKNDPSRFLGEGITFKAKLIGILEVSEARGDKMCQDALNDLKVAIRAAGEHKQRITISISIDGLRLRDEKTGDCLYHHPVHKISFIAQDMSDSRAFGYIFGSPDTGHRFFGIKTDKTASQVVISMRDLFQVVFELKKKEIEMAKHHSEQHQLKYAGSAYIDSIHFSKDDSDADKTRSKYSHLLKSRCLTSKSDDPSTSDYKGPTSEAIADLLDLEHELNSIQQGITQMEKITPSDPFGPLSKPEPYIDPFEDSFPAKPDKPPEDTAHNQPPASLHTDDPPPDHDKHSSLFPQPPSSSNPPFFSHFSPGTSKAKQDDAKWFHQEADSLFGEAVSVGVNTAEPTSSPVAPNTVGAEADQVRWKKRKLEGKKSPVKTDLFTELDPLGTGRVKPYIDKKDFFQELKNPPKKLLKELITETTTTEPSSFYFPTTFKEDKTPTTAKSDSAHSSSTIDSAQGFTPTPKYAKIDPFEENDPFDKTDPFQEESFPSLFPNKPSTESIFDDKPSWKFDSKDAPPKPDFPLLPSATLRVSLPPEKIDPNPSNIKSPLDSPENIKALRRKNYHALKQTTVDASEDSPVHEEPFISSKIPNPLQRPEGEKRTPCKDRCYSLQSPPAGRSEKSKTSSADLVSDVTTPDPPPRGKTSLFFIKPPPLPPKKSAHSVSKPPARPPSLEGQYDYLDKREPPPSKDDLKCIKLKRHVLAPKNSPPPADTKKQTSDASFPILPPPPHRKPDAAKPTSARIPDKHTPAPTPTPTPTPGSILNLKLNQLDNTGLENLAITLGIPSENIYSMTLQELTKMLAEKYLISEAKPPHPPTDSFEVDFDANFANMDVPDPKSAPSYDKYAVFKELMDNESKATAQHGDGSGTEASGQEEDRYAALRQLSLSVNKCEIASEDEEGGRGEGSSPAPEEFPRAINNLDLVGEMVTEKWAEGKAEVTGGQEEAEVGDQEGQSCLFPLVDEFSSEKPNGKDNWATFEKSDFGDTPTKKGGSAFENETSPVSSDGKEDVREMRFQWEERGFRKRRGKDIPWQDDDESWDDYSPKESFCSDESSHEERSPDPRRSERFEKGGWEVCGRGERKWKNRQWGQREKWNEETEDEFEESWRKQRERTSSYEFDRKSGAWHNSYGKHHEWCNSWSEPWDENDRHVHCYVNLRKRSESDNEYRKRCDSDASEKECVWTFQKNYGDSLSRSGKQKQYYGAGHAFRDCPEHCHESRAKHRKGAPQKRPTSASESSRSYEKMCSPGEYTCRGPDKTYPPKPDKDDYFRYQCSRKDFRHRAESDFLHYHPDKRTPQHPKTSSRTARGPNLAQTDLYPSPKTRTDPMEPRTRNFDYFEPFREPKHRNFHFDSESDNFDKGRKSEQFLQDFQKVNQWASTNGKTTHGDGSYSARNSDSFSKFPEELKAPPKKGKESGKGEAGAEGKGKGPLVGLHRQESSATLRKSDSINIFSRDKDPFEGDDFFSSAS